MSKGKRSSSRTSKLRGNAEAGLASTLSATPPAGSADKLLRELQAHEIALELQNETLRETQAALEESRDRYSALYEFAPVTYLTLTDSGHIVEINLTGTMMLGEERSSLLHSRFDRFVSAEDRDRWQRHFLSALQQDDLRSCELALQHGDGSHFHAGLNCRRWAMASEAPQVHMTLTDVTEHKRTEEELRIAAIVFEAQEGMLVTDPKGVIVRVNQAFTRLTGYSAEELIGRTPVVLSSGHHDQAFYQQMWQALADTGHWLGEMWNRHKDGKIYVDSLSISAVRAPDGATTHYIGNYSEIHRLANYDPLTQLPNRRLLRDRISQALSGSSRSGHYGALLLLDLDNFKMLNDTRGHDVGDQLLIEAARRIQTLVRAVDTIARLGGDEFVVMLEDLSSQAQDAAVQTELVGEKMRVSLAEPYDLGGRKFHCAASLGATLFRGQQESGDTVLKHADLAMYKAKSAGGNTVRFFDPAMQAALEERSALEADLRLALAGGQLQLHYQAQIDGARRVIGAEVLLRWVHPERGLVPPRDFIPLAEETGLILPIGLWVLETACKQIKAWSAAPATRELRLVVNVSARQFWQPEFVDQVRQVLTQTGADPTRLKIELTESLVMDKVADNMTRMQALKALGVGFSMDDFGTGFSSLSFLKRLPLDQLKIDRAFVRDIANDPNDAAIVQTIINMGKTLGLDVIPAGVETELQLERLSEYGCVAYQGYLFCVPLPLEAFEAFLERNVMHPGPPIM